VYTYKATQIFHLTSLSLSGKTLTDG
jgi:hypothetical protein